jgi:hypothetical protein
MSPHPRTVEVRRTQRPTEHKVRIVFGGVLILCALLVGEVGTPTRTPKV